MARRHRPDRARSDRRRPRHAVGTAVARGRRRVGGIPRSRGHLYGFESVAELAAFIRTEHATTTSSTTPPGCRRPGALGAELEPEENFCFDLIGVPELVGERPRGPRRRRTRETRSTWCATSVRSANWTRSPSSSTRTPCSARCPRRQRIRGPRGRGAVGPDRHRDRQGLGRRARRRSTASSPPPRWTRRPSPSPRPNWWPPTENTVDADDVAEEAEEDEEFESVDLDRRHRGHRGGGRLVLGRGRHRPGQDHHRPRETSSRCAATSTTSRSSSGDGGTITVFSSERALARYLADNHEHDLAQREHVRGDAGWRGRRLARGRGHRRERLRPARSRRRSGRGARRRSTPNNSTSPSNCSPMQPITPTTTRWRQALAKSTPLGWYVSTCSTRTARGWRPARRSPPRRRRGAMLEREFEARLRRSTNPRRSADQHRVSRLDHVVDDPQPLSGNGMKADFMALMVNRSRSLQP